MRKVSTIYYTNCGVVGEKNAGRRGHSPSQYYYLQCIFICVLVHATRLLLVG